MNESINQTLSRTILTSTVTLIPILCLFFFGGAVLRILARDHHWCRRRTYSSIFIASPIVASVDLSPGREQGYPGSEITAKRTGPATASWSPQGERGFTGLFRNKEASSHFKIL